MPMPPPPPPGPPPPAFNAPRKGASEDNRGALLQSIRQGAKLKKTVTNDKSGPAIPGKVSGSSSVGRSSPASSAAVSSQVNGMALGGLFAGGMPKLRPTGRSIGGQNSNMNTAESLKKPSPEAFRPNASNGEVFRKYLASDIKNRGPPPQPPVPVKSSSVMDSTSSPNAVPIRSPFLHKNSSASNPHINISTLHKNNGSFLHGSMSSSATNLNAMKPAISHGKPNLAPKPPGTGMKPVAPPKSMNLNGRVPVSRAQSMRVPRSPPVAPSSNPPFPPATINGKDFGTIRGVPAALHQSQENLIRHPTHSRNQTLPEYLIVGKNSAPMPPFGNRPSGPPPNRPPIPPPPSRTGSGVGLKPPLSPPPPPPVSAPPPPPSRMLSMQPAHIRLAPAVPTNGPPPPPVRNHMRNENFNSTSPRLDFESRFSKLFRTEEYLPAPVKFQGSIKVYASRNVVNKQQAPPPPSSLHLGDKLWDSSTC